MNTFFSAFFDEMTKIAKIKCKLSGEETVDPDNASRTLAYATSRPARGPHPALNFEAESDKIASIFASMFR